MDMLLDHLEPGEGPPHPEAPPESAKESQILNGAALVFAHDGYEGASMSRIAAEAAVSKGTLYNYFSSKADLFAAYVQRECERSIALIFEEADPALPPAEMLTRIGQSMMGMLLSETGLTMYRMVIAESAKFPELAQVFYAAGPARAIHHVAGYLRACTAQGRLRVADADFAAEQFFALMQTHLTFKRRLGLIGLPSEAEVCHVVERAVHLFMRGYGL